MKATKENLLFSAWLHSVGHPSERYRKTPAFFMSTPTPITASSWILTTSTAPSSAIPCLAILNPRRQPAKANMNLEFPNSINSIMRKAIVRKQSALRAIKNVSERLYGRKINCITKPIP
ncbi:MAG: hypothetical protein J6I41_08540 [Bacteroidales bacterium]|nr:hypothetical protein [Bacteroidales bacterium]